MLYRLLIFICLGAALIACSSANTPSPRPVLTSPMSSLPTMTRAPQTSATIIPTFAPEPATPSLNVPPPTAAAISAFTPTAEGSVTQPTATPDGYSAILPLVQGPIQTLTPSPVPTATVPQPPTPPPVATVPLDAIVPEANSSPTVPRPPTATWAARQYPGAAPNAPLMELRTDLPRLAYADWPRPANDNGRCMHWMRNQYFSQADLDVNLPRLQQLNAKWVLVVYADENIIHMAAPRFAEAGIIPIWRKMLRPFENFYDWRRDIELVQSYGLPPYFQVYNEPNLGQEWTDDWEGPNDEGMFINNLMLASKEIYNAGGYVGWQFVDYEWMNHAIDEVQRRGGSRLFERFFFVPHPYGENLPPNWTEDGRGVLSFLRYADELERRLGFVPPMIAGEGGWRINGQDAPQFPPMDEPTHARYHVELFDWFRTGTLSNGEPLPDYLFAYCPWLIAERGDDNAWWDSFAGNRDQTIQAVSAMPPFVRRFSWE